jgi:PAS domain S-box-containing protein
MSYPGACQLKIDDADEFYGKPYPLDFFPDTFKKDMSAKMEEAKKTGKTLEIRGILADTEGNQLWYQHLIAPVYDEQGKPEYLLIVSMDISQQKKAEEALLIAKERAEESEERYRALAESAQDFIVIHDMEGRIEYVNKPALKFSGLSKEELYNANILEFVPEEFRPYMMDRYQQRSDGFKGLNLYESKFMNKKGESLPVEAVSTTISSESGPPRILIIARDISERKRTEAALRESEERYRNVFINSPVGIYRSSPEGKFIMANPTLLNMLGYDSFKELSEIDIYKDIYLNPEERYTFCETIEKEGYTENYERRWKRKDGKIIYVNENARAISDSSGNYIYYEGTVEDVTRKKEAEKELIESEERFRTTFEQAAVGIAHITPLGEFIRVNERFCEIIGYSESEMKAIEFQTMIHQDDFMLPVSYIDKQMNNEINSFRVEIRYSHKSGRYVWINLFSTAVRDDSGKIKYIVLAADDITQRRKAQAELQRVSKLESLGTLAGGIAHNFKNILASISLSAELARLKPGKLNKYLDIIENSVEKATALATRFQLFTKGGEPVKEIIEIGKVIEEAISMALSGSNCVAEVTFDPDINSVNADPRQMNELFMNLLINAKQAMPRGGNIFITGENITLEENEIASLSAGEYVKIALEDEGIGITAEDLKYIFDPFYTTKEEGHGLGLSSVHFIVQKHHGHIGVYSEIGSGTKFNIYLPADDEIPARLPEPDEEIAKGEFSRILIMDDEDHIRESIIEFGEALDYRIVGVSKGEEAIMAYKEAYDSGEPFEAVILDLTVKGGMGGKETLEELRSFDPKAKAIVFSGYSNKPIVAHYRDYGFDAKLVKPVSVKQLAKTLREVLAK